MTMRYKKLFEQEIEFDIIDLSTISDVFYHGTILMKDSNLPDTLEIGYSDFNALWFTDEEDIAKEFMKGKIQNNNMVGVIYKVNLNCKNTLDINESMYQTIQQELDLYDDLRDYLDYFKNIGYDSWITSGSIGSDLYKDVAIFYEDDIKIIEVKLLINKKWTKYMPIIEVQKAIETI